MTTSAGGSAPLGSHDRILDIAEESGTGDVTAPAIAPDRTRTAAALLTENVGALRRRVANLSGDIRETHQRTYEHEWQVLTQQRGVQSPLQLLEELADLGFAWRDIARLVGVSVPAVQKWRKGERASGDNRLGLAKLVAACDFIASHFYVEDPASWFEMPIVDGAPITPIDLWSEGRHELLFEYLTRHLTPSGTLDRFDPEWREHLRTDFASFLDEDGHLGLRMQKD